MANSEYEDSVKEFESATTQSSDADRRKTLNDKFEARKSELGFGNLARDFVRLGVQGATFGLAPKLVRAFGTQEDEDAYLKEIDSARENLGPLGEVADFAGSMATPIPGLGLLGKVGKGAVALGKRVVPAVVERAIPKVIGKTAARIGGKALESAGEGAAIGGGLGVARKFGQTATDDLNAGDVATAGVEGMEGGAIAGGVLRGAGEMLKAHSANVRAAAAGGDVGAIRRLAKKNPSVRTGLTDLEQSLSTAEQKGVIGGIGRTAKGVNERANALVDEYGQHLESLYGQIDNEMAKRGATLKTDYVKKTAFDTLLKGLGAQVDASGNIVGNNLTGDMVKALEKVQNNIDTMFAGASNKTTIVDLWQKKKNLGLSVHGIRGADPISTLADVYTRGFQNALDDTIRLTAERVSPSLSADLAHANHVYHAAKIAQDMSAGGATSNAGRHYFGLGVHGLTSVLGVSGAASVLEKLAPKAIGGDPLLAGGSRLLGAAAGLRGPAANTELWLARQYGKFGPSFGKAAGVIGGQMASSHTPAQTREGALDALLNKRGPNYSPRSPLNHD